MKVKLLKKLRRIVASEVTIYSITTTNDTPTGMDIGYSEYFYRGLFSYGDTEQDVMHKAWIRYLENNIEFIRNKYFKYSRKYKFNL